jgi:hypothetical protein
VAASFTMVALADVAVDTGCLSVAQQTPFDDTVYQTDAQVE